MMLPIDLIFQIHGVFGLAAIGFAAAAIVLAKGGRLHRLAGRGFLIAISVFFIAGMTVAFERNNIFMMLVGILAFYLALSGYRIHTIAQAGASDYLKTWLRVGPIDKGSAQFVLIASAAATAWGLDGWTREPQAMGLIVLGLGGATLAIGDLRRFRQQSWRWSTQLRHHGGRMVAAVLTMAIGFSSVSFSAWPFWLRLSVACMLAIGCLLLLDRWLKGWAEKNDEETVGQVMKNKNNGGIR